MAQTTITYTYDSAGNRTGRAVAVQLLADTSEGQAVEVCLFSRDVVDKDASPSQSDGNAFCAVTPYPGEQKQPLVLIEEAVGEVAVRYGLDLRARQRMRIGFVSMPQRIDKTIAFFPEYAYICRE